MYDGENPFQIEVHKDTCFYFLFNLNNKIS